MPPSPKRLRRAKRARAKQRPRGHDLRSQYRKSDLPATSHIGVMTIEDPYSDAGRIDSAGNLVVAAQLEPVRHADGTVSEGQPAWSPPSRPLMTVIRALKDDPVGRMHSRRQIDEAQYKAARAFQECADRATLGSMRSVDLAKTKVSGGLPADPLPMRNGERWCSSGRPRSDFCSGTASKDSDSRAPFWSTARALSRPPDNVALKAIARPGSGRACSDAVLMCWPRRSALPRQGTGHGGRTGMLSRIPRTIRGGWRARMSWRTCGCGRGGRTGRDYSADLSGAILEAPGLGRACKSSRKWSSSRY